MNLLEYQSKNLLARAGIAVPAGMVLDGRMDIRTVLSSLGLSEGVLKAQIPAGGRGIAGGIRFVRSVEEAEAAAKELIGTCLVTHQTGPKGIAVREILFEELISSEKEYYLGITIDRSSGVPVIVFSPEGGRAVEEVAKTSPGKVQSIHANHLTGMSASDFLDMALSFGMEGEEAGGLAGVINILFDLFSRMDALLVEINPLSLVDNRFIALDAKISIDDNSLFRHPEILSLKETYEGPLDREAREAGISYLRLDGDVGCLANGAGLAMATMDMITLAGRSPANFLDIGGSAHHQQVSSALRILFSDPKERAIFINIFGGMIHCDLISSEIVESIRSLNPRPPIVVRLEGTDAEKGRRIIADSGLPVIMVSDIEEGMERIKNL